MWPGAGGAAAGEGSAGPAGGATTATPTPTASMAASVYATVVVWFSTGYVTIKDMVVTGMPIKIVGVAALTVLLPMLAGAPLSSHPDVDKVAFTGSYATGQNIMVAAAPTVKPLTLELGGKSPIVVFDDVDIDKG
ncbi:hypothetical protein ZWY2020_057543 [Hordeum vulgare]|nr:hypothetical protein ZWY2020_057543 [Hordeum vulgare]